MDFKITFSKTIVAGTVALLMSQSAGAALYISPADGLVWDKEPAANTQVKAKPASKEAPAEPAAKATEPAGEEVKAETAAKEPKAEPVSAPRKDAVIGFGSQIPLELAIKQVVPQGGCWKVNIDRDVSGRKVSWSGGDEWQSILNRVAGQHGFKAHIDEANCVIGIAPDGELAKQYAKPHVNVWHLDPAKSLRENLSAWADQAGWHLAWDTKMDFPIEYPARLFGPLAGEEGAVAQVLNTLLNSASPLKAEFKLGNRVIWIKESGFNR